MSNEEITVSLRTVLNSIEPLNEFISIPMPAATSFNVRKIASSLEKERESAMGVIQDKKKEYFEDVDNPQKEEIEKYNKEIEKLLEVEVTLKGRKVNVSDLGTASIKPVTLLALEWLVVG